MKMKMNFINEIAPPDYNDVLNKLQDYMLTEQKIQNTLQAKQHGYCYGNGTNIVVNKFKGVAGQGQGQGGQQQQKRLFEPREKDSLFWCFFVMKNGLTEYQMMQHRNYIVEKKIKIEYVEKLRTQKALIKSYKLATLIHLESKLANDDKIDVSALLALCVMENLNVLFVKKRTYYELLTNDSDEIHVIHCLDMHKYGYESSTKTQAAELKSPLFQIDNFEKPMKAVSSYKLQDLVDICNKLNLDTINKDTNKSKKKNELYESIIQYI